MTTPRPISMQRHGHTERHQYTDNTRTEIRVDWSAEDAVDGLVHEWLHPIVTDLDGNEIDATPEHLDAIRRTRRTIRDGAGKVLGVLISQDEYREGIDAIHRINEDAYGTDAQSYMPFVHAPNATTDRIINTDTLERIIRNIRHGKDTDITREERDTIHYEALVAAIEFGFDEDSRGLVPVMTPTSPADSPWNEFHWSFLKKTPVPGIYLRIDDSVVGGLSYTLTTGSGYALVGGFWDEDYAKELAVKLANALPGLNWFSVHGGALTEDIKKTATTVIREHGRFRPEEIQVPELSEHEQAEADRFGIHEGGEAAL